ncbi:hypothetical protein R1flu_012507 [Riccia fluitans]|uniref:Uncharacterized protein n=1 Tax=Riccia fluitans TaxID=41844 RepID=A0ABD1ZAZ2_9MARC
MQILVLFPGTECGTGFSERRSRNLRELTATGLDKSYPSESAMHFAASQVATPALLDLPRSLAAYQEALRSTQWAGAAAVVGRFDWSTRSGSRCKLRHALPSSVDGILFRLEFDETPWTLRVVWSDRYTFCPPTSTNGCSVVSPLFDIRVALVCDLDVGLDVSQRQRHVRIFHTNFLSSTPLIALHHEVH